MTKGANRTPDHGPNGGLKPALKAIAPAKCGASTKGGNSTCGQPAGFGTEHPGWGHCVFHFGKSPTGNAYAEKVRTNVHAIRATLDFGIPVETTPEKALADEINRSVGMVAWIAGQLREWEIGEDGKVVVTHITEEGQLLEIRVPALVGILASSVGEKITQAFRDERAHLAKVAKYGIDAKLIDRQQQLDERRLDMMDDVITAIVRDLGHDPNDNAVRAVVSKRLLERAAS